MIYDFRNNPKLGDGNLRVMFTLINASVDFRDNPKLGDGNLCRTSNSE